MSEIKFEFFKTKIKWIGHKIDQAGIQPLQDKLLATKKLKQPKNEKELKSFLGAIQYISKYIDMISAQTNSLRQPLKKNNEWIGTEEQTQAFEIFQQKITEIAWLAHYNSDYPNVIITDALWQEQPDRKLKQIGFASRFLSDIEKNMKKMTLNYLQ